MGAMLIVMVFLAYRPAARGEFIWDDNDYVSENPTLVMPGGLWVIWAQPTASPQYYPLVFTTFWIEARMWGMEARGYHETNILLHGVAAVLLWRILRRLNVPGAYFAAGIFAVHPVMVESVAWVTERKNTLSMVFYLGAFYCSLRFWTRPASGAAKRGWGWYASALALFVCALLSKTVTATLPAAMVLILWWKLGRVALRDWFLLAPFFVLGICGGVLTGYLERTHVGASGAEWNYSVVERVLIAGRAVWFYAWKLVWPLDLAFMYGKWRVDPRAAWQWVFPTAAVVVVVMLFVLRKRIGRGPVVAVLFFVGTLAPALGFVNVYPMRYALVADHYQYHASIGLIALLAAVLTTLYHRAGMGRRGLRGAPAGCAVLLPLFVLTWRQASIYRDRQTLWSDTLAKVPDSWMAWIHLGNVAATKTPPDKGTARAYWRKALELNPNVADTHYNMGVAYADADDYSSAVAEFRRTIELEPRKADPRNMLGVSLAGLGRLDEGIEIYRGAIAIEPYHWKSHFNLGIALERKGQVDAAVEEFLKTAELSPRYGPALRELANCLIKTGRYAQAEGPLRRLVELRPEDADALFDLGMVLSLQQRSGEAEPFLLKAFSIKPELRQRLQGKR